MENKSSQPGRDSAPLILIIDDEPTTVTLVGRFLHKAGYRTVSAENGRMGIEIARKYKPNIILLDINMPDMDGYAVCEQLKSCHETEEIPVIFIAAVVKTDDILRQCFDVGAYDFIAKPVDRVVLDYRIRVVLREQAVREAYRRSATEDHATGLMNRRQFIKEVDQAVDTARAGAGEVFLILADIEGTEQANTRLGYEFGDELVLTFARLVHRFASLNYRSARIGSDEFGILMTNASKTQAVELADRVRCTFAAIVFDADSDPKHFTANFGLACYHGDPPDFNADAFLGQADIALCAAKEAGRNRALAFWQLDPDALPKFPPDVRHFRTRPRQPTQRAFVGALDPPAAQELPESAPGADRA